MNKPKQLTFPWNKVNKSSLEGFYTSQENFHLLSLLKDNDFLGDLFIYGTKESGKTFLLQAMCNFYSSMTKSSLYVPLKKVMNYGVEIFESLENIDLICIDGIEEVISKIEWEKAIFNLINKALISDSRLILTSSKDLKSLNFLLPDLESRIRKIQSYELYPINDEDIFDALKYISKLTSINLGDKEAKYLVTYSQRNISNLVHILESLDQLSMEMKRKITIPLIKEVI
ncbi:MAG: DNA replication initiation factor [Proteobacteria bacterium]|nr:DNA replication initiation factor [Pseudomonadota bacterium]